MNKLKAAMMRVKSPETLIAEAEGGEHGPMHKHLSAFDLLAFGVGATIGSGILLSPAPPLRDKRWLLGTGSRHH
ncbi:MAG: hypothetical protein IPL73_15355 [Candidatus Obscuribacter sp.]|nr:hypothetical protein [Candidatus Obscuribacter sp.]